MSEWPLSKHLQTRDAGEAVEKRKPAYSADGNVNWCSHQGEEYGGSGLVTKSCLALVTPQAVAHQAPLSKGIPRQENWNGLPFPSPGELPNPGTEPTSPTAHALAGEFFTTMPPILGKKKKQCFERVVWSPCLYFLSILSFLSPLLTAALATSLKLQKHHGKFSMAMQLPTPKS